MKYIFKHVLKKIVNRSKYRKLPLLQVKKEEEITYFTDAVEMESV
jgi:hypothetical protein